MVDIDRLLDRVELYDVVTQAGGSLRRRGRQWRGACVLHGGDNLTSFSLFVGQDGRERWHCFACETGGDAIDFVTRWQGVEFVEAVRWLAEFVGMRLDDLGWSKQAAEREQRRRSLGELRARAMRYYQQVLGKKDAAAGAAATAWAYVAGRGWTDETVYEAGLGLADGQLWRKAAEVGANLDDLWRAGLVKKDRDGDRDRERYWDAIPAGYLVYPHRRRQRVEFVAGRAIWALVDPENRLDEGERKARKARNAHNDSGETPRRPFWVGPVGEAQGRTLVVVEGQGDAITWAQAGCWSVAQAGGSADETLVGKLRRWEGNVVLGPDVDEEGQKFVARLAEELHPLTQVVTAWPGGATDSNEALVATLREADLETANQALMEALASSLAWLEILADQSRDLPSGETRDAALRKFMAAVNALDEVQLVTRRRELAERAGLGVREFDQLRKAVAGEQEEDQADRPAVRREMVTPGGYCDEHLFEQVITSDGSRYAVRFPDGAIAIESELELGHYHFRPIPADNDLIAKHVVLFPSAVVAYEDLAQLQRRVQTFVHTYLDVEAFYEKMASYYVLFTWLYDAFDILPYLRALGDYGTGKTRFLQAIGHLCYRPMFLGGASTTSPIFRIIDHIKGTLILDEADFGNSDAEVDIIKILNTGYMKGFPVLRTEKVGDDFVVVAMDVYGPKIIATRRRYKDKALESRMLTHEMNAGRPREDIPIMLPGDFRAQATALRNQLLYYRLTHW
ncbi:MAG: CHC2 zinc finger domain-containing protein, partial [Anaerolineae bacterium]